MENSICIICGKTIIGKTYRTNNSLENGMWEALDEIRGNVDSLKYKACLTEVIHADCCSLWMGMVYYYIVIKKSVSSERIAFRTICDRYFLQLCSHIDKI